MDVLEITSGCTLYIIWVVVGGSGLCMYVWVGNFYATLGLCNWAVGSCRHLGWANDLHAQFRVGVYDVISMKALVLQRHCSWRFSYISSPGSIHRPSLCGMNHAFLFFFGIPCSIFSHLDFWSVSCDRRCKVGR